MRCDQFIGLNEFARNLVNQNVTVRDSVTRTYPDGRQEKFEQEVNISVVKSEPSGHKFFGMFEDEYDLNKYTLPDGRVFIERLQAETWSSGPMFFLCLTDEDARDIPESLWSEEAINEYR